MLFWLTKIFRLGDIMWFVRRKGFRRGRNPNIVKIHDMPKFKCFKPENSKGEIKLTYSEYEAIRLVDYLGLGCGEAAKMMHVSKPTFWRILDSARNKLAKALVECKKIRIEEEEILENKENWSYNFSFISSNIFTKMYEIVIPKYTETNDWTIGVIIWKVISFLNIP